jgi:hypothetical protein
MVARIGSVLATAALGMTLALGNAHAQAPAQDDQDHSAHHPPGSEAQAQATPPAPPTIVPPQPGRPATSGMGMMPGPDGQPGMMGGDMGQMMQMMQRMMAMRAGAGMMRHLDRIDAHLAYARAALHITDAQAPQWNAFAEAARTAAQGLRQALAPAVQAAGQPLSAPEQLERHAVLLSAQLEATRAMARAAKPLYDALSDEQKRTANELMADHLRDMRMRGM